MTLVILITMMSFLSLIAADYATPVPLHQHALYLTGSFEMDIASITESDKVEINYSVTGPASAHPNIVDLNRSTIEIFQRPLAVVQGEFTTTKTPLKLPIDPFSFQKLNATDPLQFALNQNLAKTPGEYGLKVGDAIRVCIHIAQNNNIWLPERCFDHIVVPSALNAVNLPSNAIFRSFCNGESPPQPAFEVTSTAIQPGCGTPERFHINAYAIIVPNGVVAPTLTFRIFNHADIRTHKGEDSPDSLICRVNTHWVTFTRSNRLEDETKRAFYPGDEVIYVADNVSELKNDGAIEISCDDAGLHYPIHYNDQATKDRITVPNIMYDTFVQVTISEAPTAARPWATQPSFTIFFNQPALLNPIDLDLHSSSTLLKTVVAGNKDTESVDYFLQRIVQSSSSSSSSPSLPSLFRSQSNNIDTTVPSEDGWYDISLFGSFYLTGLATKKDRIDICPLGITLNDNLTVLITQQNFNATTNSTVPMEFPIPLFQDKVLVNELNHPNNFIPSQRCFSIDLFHQFPWRPKYTKTPQLFHFTIGAQVKEYQARSAIYSRVVSHTNDPTVPLMVYSTTPLPSHTTPFATKLELSPVKYIAEDAETHSTYSAKLHTIKFSGLRNTIDRVVVILAGGHYFDGDIQCLFKYLDISGDQIEDEISASIDRSVQSARMITFDLEYPIDKDRNLELMLECKGMFATSFSVADFQSQSIFHIFGRDSTTKEFTLTTLPNFTVVDAENAPQPVLPTNPQNDDDDDDDETGKKKWVRIAIIAGVTTFAIILIVLIIVVTKTKKTAVYADPLLDGIDDVQYIH